MGSSTQTPNLALPQFGDNDKPTWRGDFNDAMGKIDTAHGTFTTEIGAINTDGSPSQSAGDARWARNRIVPASAVQAWGHSYMSGVVYGGTVADGMATKIAAALGLPLSNHAVGGTALYNYLSADANWVSVLRDAKRQPHFDTPGGYFPVMYGMNDIANLGLTDAALEPFKQALRAVVSRFRSGGFFADQDPSVVLGGSGAWSASADNPYVGGHLSYNNTPGATVTITTDASFPGGFVCPIFGTWTESPGGAVWTGSGAAAGYSLDTTTIARTESRDVAVLRVPAAPGAGTYTFTSSADSGAVGGVFMGWQWEPIATVGPLVALVKQPKPLDYVGYAGSAFVPTDASVDTLNAIIDSVAAEFGSRVISVDTSVMDKNATYFVAGNVHPTPAGHTEIANLVVSATKNAATLLTAGPDAVGPPVVTPPPAWEIYTPVLSGTGTALGDGTVNGVFVDYPDGTTHFYCQIVLGSTSTIGSDVEISLPHNAFNTFSFAALSVWAEDVGTSYSSLGTFVSDPSKVQLMVNGVNGLQANVATTAPFTWETNDVIQMRGTFRRA